MPTTSWSQDCGLDLVPYPLGSLWDYPIVLWELKGWAHCVLPVLFGSFIQLLFTGVD